MSLQKALVLLKSGDYDKCAKYLVPLLSKDRFGDAHYHLAVCRMFSGNAKAAIELFKNTLSIKGDRYDALNGLALAHEMCGNLSEALRCAELAVGYARTAENLNNYAKILVRLGKKEEADKTLSELTHLYPAHAEGRLQRAQFLDLCNRKGELQDELEHIVQRNIGGLDSKKWLAQVYISRGLTRKATDLQKTYLNQEYSAKSSEAIPKLIDAFLKIVDINRPFYQSKKDEDSAVEEYISACKVIGEIFDNSDNRDISAELWLELIFLNSNFYLAYISRKDVELNSLYASLIQKILKRAGASVQLTQGEPDSRQGPEGKRVRIALISEVYGIHVSRWVLPWLDALKAYSKRLDITIISINGDGMNPTLRAYERFGQIKYLRVGPTTIRSAINEIRALNLHLLHFIDIGMSITSRILSCVRMASVQTTHWTHPVTSGSDCIDFFITSRRMEMESMAGTKNYRERLIRLPHVGASLEAPPTQLLVDSESLGGEIRADIASIQSNFKHGPAYDRFYLEILKKTKATNLGFLYEPGDYTEQFFERLRIQAEKIGVDPNRIIRLRRRPHREFLLLISGLRLSLDAIGWAGGNTTLNCFHLGVPVIASPPGLMRANHTRAMYEIMGIKGLSPNTPEEFTDLAVSLIQDQKACNQYSELIKERAHLLTGYKYDRAVTRIFKILENNLTIKY